MNQGPLFCCNAKYNTYNNNVDLVNDDVYTEFGLILSIHFQDIELKPNSDINQGP